ncbi:hypothetical protein KGY79_11855, partial [Candidatus Bipolaricaulota bacterium]|nr:hypothetical protein [Candidatus Bipolaricaulota bacterium]
TRTPCLLGIATVVDIFCALIAKRVNHHIMISRIPCYYKFGGFKSPAAVSSTFNPETAVSLITFGLHFLLTLHLAGKDDHPNSVTAFIRIRCT